MDEALEQAMKTVARVYLNYTLPGAVPNQDDIYNAVIRAGLMFNLRKKDAEFWAVTKELLKEHGY